MTQEEFNKKYITTSEISAFVGVTVAAVWYAKNNGKLPNCIEVQGTRVMLWERDTIMPLLEQWKDASESRKQWQSC